MRTSSTFRFVRLFAHCLLFTSFAFPITSRHSLAFESIEHQMLGDTAILIAVDYWLHGCDDGPCEPTLKWSDLCDAIAVEANIQSANLISQCSFSDAQVGRVTYGQLVERVDHMAYAAELFVSRRSPPTPSDSPSAMIALNRTSPYLIRSVPEDFRDLHEAFTANFRDHWTPKRIRVTSFNQTHFQGEALRQLVTLHEAAINFAEDGYVFAALVTNALADHFLHDIFAPGHISTVRENVHDAVSLGMHDNSNQMGAEYRINKDGWTDLRPIADFIQKRLQQGVPDYYRFWIFPSQNERRGTEQQETTSERQMTEAFAQLPGDYVFHGYGDSQLSKNPVQQAFLLLVSVRSALDVLETYTASLTNNGAAAEVTNHFNEYVWTGSFAQDLSVIPPVAQIRYGGYHFRRAASGYASTILLFAYGGQVPFRDIGSVRQDIGLEVVPLGLLAASETMQKMLSPRPDCKLLSWCNVAPAVGVRYLSDDDAEAFGGTFRMIKVIPNTNVQLSVYFHRLRFSYDSLHKWRNAYGARLGIGFSLVSMYLAAERGSIFDGSDLDRTGMISFGVAFGLPVSHFRKIYSRYDYMPKR